MRRLEFHYTPRQARWLNMAEIEIGVMRRQCLDRRIDNRDLPKSEFDAWAASNRKWRSNPMDVLDRPSPRKDGKTYPIPCSTSYNLWDVTLAAHA